MVIGGGDAAVEEACFLTRFAEKVTIVHRRDRLRAARVIQERAFSNGKISFIWNSVPEMITGESKVDGLRIRDVNTREVSDVPCDGVFIFIGWEPNTDYIKGIVKTDDNGRVIADDNMRTSADGVFAAGDCRKKLLYQVVTACGDGATAAYAAQHYAESLKGTAYDR
jgi:thioredoxin reductase (NADPH)